MAFSLSSCDFSYNMKKLKKTFVGIGFFALAGLSWGGSWDDFFNAIRLDNPNTLQALLQRGFDPNTVDQQGTPALMRALQEQSYRAAEVLADHPQIRAEVRSPRDESPLMLAALRGQDALVVKLVSKGAAVNKSGWTPLHYAATGGHVRIAAFLIGAHADVNAESPNGTTPLMMAAMYSSSDMVKLLLESGAEAYPRNDLDLSAEDFAVKAGRDDSVRLIRQVLQR
ncbi:ankyrin repeat domain-containing protein [Limnohabitans sp.]|uniref:ankyrin repeat domain-containing protein n=1 Tax=Limnohabitans sp. TaxID=1907725 RepID=UPI0035AF60AC